MKLKILAPNDALDDRGGRTQGFDVADETGRVAWLRPALRHRLENGQLDLKPGDVVLAQDFVFGGGTFPLLVAESIRKIMVGERLAHSAPKTGAASQNQFPVSARPIPASGTRALSRQPEMSFDPVEIDFTALRSRRRIAIDGDPGSGKTTLAKKLEGELGARVFSLDDYLYEDGRSYVAQIKYEELARDIAISGESPAVIEGVCLLKALAKISFHHDYLIFAKCFIHGRREFDDYSNPRIPLPKSSLRREIVSYYREYRPETVCDLARNLNWL